MRIDSKLTADVSNKELLVAEDGALPAMRTHISDADSLEELSGWLGTFHERLRVARTPEKERVAALISDLEARYRQRRAELA